MKLNQGEFSLKMYPQFELEDWEKCYKAYMRSGTMQNGTVYQLPTLGPSTNGTERGLLPTPVASDGKMTYRWSKHLARAKRQSYTAKKICILSAITPLDDPSVCLNPSFAEQMMGFPEGWTDLSK
jgi:hypothetical protein